MQNETETIQGRESTSQNMQSTFLRQQRKSVAQSVRSLSDERARRESQWQINHESVRTNSPKLLSSLYNCSSKVDMTKKNKQRVEIDAK